MSKTPPWSRVEHGPIERMNAGSRKPHVLIVCRSLGAGGSVASAALNQIRQLSDEFAITALTEVAPSDLKSEISCSLLRVHQFVWLRRFGHVPREIAFARAARKELRRHACLNRIDFILCHGYETATLAAAEIKREFRIPFGLVSHGEISDQPVGTWDPIVTRFYAAVTPPAYRAADLIIALSPRIRDLAVLQGAHSDNVCLIPHGIDPEEVGLDSRIPPPAKLSGSEPMSLLYVGGLRAVKGVDVLLETCSLLSHRGFRFELRIIGDGPMRGELIAEAKARNLGHCVQFLGQMPRPALGHEYLSAHVVCIPSRSEALGLVVLEALIAGRPIAGSDVGGIPFLLSRCQAGRPFPSGSAKELAWLIEDMYARYHDYALVAQRSAKIARKMFTWKVAGKILASEIRRVIERAEDVNV
jgi:glycosyltransferase involved in cell wall biosynthesis